MSYMTIIIVFKVRRLHKTKHKQKLNKQEYFKKMLILKISKLKFKTIFRFYLTLVRITKKNNKC